MTRFTEKRRERRARLELEVERRGELVTIFYQCPDCCSRNPTRSRIQGAEFGMIVTDEDTGQPGYQMLSLRTEAVCSTCGCGTVKGGDDPLAERPHLVHAWVGTLE